MSFLKFRWRMSEHPADIAIVLSTLPDNESARELARRLVDERLIACGNIVPGIRSIFRWKGAIEDASEVLLVMKTATELLPELRERIEQLHPYEVPEVIAVHADDVSGAYGYWVRHETIEGN